MFLEELTGDLIDFADANDKLILVLDGEEIAILNFSKIDYTKFIPILE